MFLFDCWINYLPFVVVLLSLCWTLLVLKVVEKPRRRTQKDPQGLKKPQCERSGLFSLLCFCLFVFRCWFNELPFVVFLHCSQGCLMFDHESDGWTKAQCNQNKFKVGGSICHAIGKHHVVFYVWLCLIIASMTHLLLLFSSFLIALLIMKVMDDVRQMRDKRLLKPLSYDR